MTLATEHHAPSEPPATAAARAHGEPGARAPLILGFGNTLLCDDATGVRVVEQIRMQDWAHSRALVCLDCGTLSYTILPYLDDTDTLVVIDAAEIGATPGSVRVYADAAMDRFLRSSRRRTVHEVGLTDLLDMARVQDSLPSRRALICVQPELIDWRDSLSPHVLAAVPVAVGAVLDQLRQWEA